MKPTPAQKQDKFEERFWSHVRIPENVVTECWEWTGQRDRDGYGCFFAVRKSHRAHRVAHELVKGLLDDALVVLHSCDNPGCCNPHHLRGGTHEENMRDKQKKGRAVGGVRTLTKESVLVIREMYAAKKATQEALAKLFNVTRENILQVVNRKTWRWV